jgi:hypothetical protein
MSELFDVIEVIIDIPKENVRAGMQGAIVEKFSDEAYLVEFANEEGETLDLWSFTTDQFIVVWRNATHDWVPITEQTAAIIARLPKEAAHEVLDFARFLAVRTQEHGQQSSPKTRIEQSVTA